MIVVEILLVFVVNIVVVGVNVVVLVCVSVDLMFVRFEVVVVNIFGVMIINDIVLF